jgi:PAS domain S-box-containing protein
MSLARFRQFFWQLKLAWKFSLAFVLIVVVMLLGLYAGVASLISESIYSEYRDRGLAISQNLATNLIDPILLDSTPRIQLLLKNAGETTPEIAYSFLSGPNGRIVSHTFSGGFPTGLKIINQPGTTEAYRLQTIETERGRILDIAIPILQSDAWTIHVGFSGSAIEEKLARIRQTIFWISLLVALLAIGLGTWLSRLITRPLDALAAGAEKIRQGNLDYRVPSAGSDEVGAVTGAFNQMVATLQDDIARRTRVENALRTSEELYRSLVDNIEMGITLIDREFNVVMANATQGKLLEKAPELLVGKRCYQQFEKRENPCPHCPGIAAMQEGKTVEAVTSGIRADGSHLTVRIKAFPVVDEHQRITGFIELVEDITGRLQVEKDLANEKERLLVTLRSIGDGVITTDVAGNIQLVNQAAEQLTGWSQAEALGKPLPEVLRIVTAQTRLPCENPVKKVMDSRQIVGFDNQTLLISKSGREFYIDDSGAPIMDKEGQVIGVVLVFRDVTDQLRKEKELLKIAKLESVGVLAGGIAHDFNNILMAILGNLSLAQLDPTLKKSTHNHLEKAAKASVRAKGLTQQLLTFAKGGAPIKETTSLTEVVMDSANFVLSGHSVTCHFDIPEDLWMVEIDKGQISQVVQNLVLNASQAMPDGGVMEISCHNHAALPEESTHRIGRFVVLAIRDHGTGIPTQVADKIFDPFFTTKPGGSGLGLSITNSIIAKHGGKITFETTPGSGSVFSVYLPAAEIEPETETLVTKTAEPRPRAKTILVMDDEEMIREVAKAMLEHLGHEILLARDGEEALSLYREKMTAGLAPDLVIMDLTIPGAMGGQEAVGKLLRLNPGAKVVVASGYSNDPILAEYTKHGFIAAISKPFQLHELERIVSNLLA